MPLGTRMYNMADKVYICDLFVAILLRGSRCTPHGFSEWDHMGKFFFVLPLVIWAKFRHDDG